MPSKINNIHDKFLKQVLSDKEASIAFLEEFIPLNIQNQLEFSSLELTDKTFITDQLEESFADIVFTVKTKTEKNLTLSILLEHKSYIDHNTCFQVLEYLALAYKKQRQNKEKITAILPIVFYHGAKNWEYRKIDYYFKDYDEDIQQYIPNQKTQFIDLGKIKDEHILNIKNGFLAAAMMLQKNYENPKVLLDSILKIQNTLEPYLDNSKLRSIFVYFFQNERINTEEIKEKLKELPSPQKDKIMSLYDQLMAEGIEKGIEKGIKKGIEKGKIEESEKIIINAFKNQISIETIRIITGESIEKINEILNKNGLV